MEGSDECCAIYHVNRYRVLGCSPSKETYAYIPDCVVDQEASRNTRANNGKEKNGGAEQNLNAVADRDEYWADLSSCLVSVRGMIPQ